ncbi:minor tail protein [Gordonia phage GourdThymes]|uniref:Minor tail protein n=1 Tax=Gordonia phage Monty TaxID=1838073 RepID=A0A160DDS9_9CAUD|nr:tail protein [Gordonia phage Monty]ANA85892.1 minor tail protein [Gordonia phage Monty]QOP64682.1 minor tail protein [Gordonia phage GourdThymes]
MPQPPREDIQRAFVAPTVQVIRRVEIYEQDGTTPWKQELWDDILINGTVSLDYNRDERRALDCELDNSYGDLDPQHGGLWYDKRFKLFYGIELDQDDRGVRAVIVEEYLAPGQAAALKQHLSAHGISEVHFLPSATDYAHVQDYDVIVAISSTSLQKLSLLNQCYSKGKGIVTFANDQTSASMPSMIGSAGAATVLAGQQLTYAPIVGASDLSVGWDGWSGDGFSQEENLVTWGGQGFESFSLGPVGSPTTAATIVQVPDGPAGTPSKVYTVQSSGSYRASTQLFSAPVVAGDVYYFEAWVRKTTPGVTGAVSFVRRTSVDGTGSILYSGMTIQLSAMNQNQWYKLSGTMPIQAGRNTLHPYVQVDNTIPVGETIQWDDVYVKKVDPQDSYRKILSPAAGAQTVATLSDSVNGDSVGAVSRVGSAGQRWVHTVASDFTAPTLAGDYESFGRYVSRIVSWASSYEALDYWEIQLGEFMADSISLGGSYATVSISGRDLTKLCQQSKFVASTTFTKNTPIESVVKTVATNAGISKFKLPITGKVLDKDMTWERDTARWDVIRDVSNSNSYEVFFDNEGYLVMREFRDPLTTPATLELSVGVGGNLISRGGKTSDANLFNHIVVVGESSDSSTPPVYAEAINTAATSPTSVQEIGDRVSIITSSLVTSVAKAQEYANALLAVSALEEFELSFESTLLPWIEVGDIVEMKNSDDRYWGPDRYLMTSLTFPLDLNPMSGAGKRTEKVEG